jgi:chromosome partitioning protein
LTRGRAVLLVDGDAQGTARTWAAVGTEAGHPVPSVVAMGATMHQAGQLDRVGAGYDLVVIDGPPRADEIQKSALMAADVAVLPCGPSAGDTWAVATSVDVIRAAQAVRPELRAVLLVTKRQAGTAIGRVVRAALERTGLPILRAELFYRVAFQEALAAGLGVGTYAPRTPAAFEVRRLYDELEALADGQEGPEHRPAPAPARRR